MSAGQTGRHGAEERQVIEYSDPAEGFLDITPDDDDDLIQTVRGLHCNVSGTAVLMANDGSEATLTLVAGMPYPYHVRRVKATGTTAEVVGLL